MLTKSPRIACFLIRSVYLLVYFFSAVNRGEFFVLFQNIPLQRLFPVPVSCTHLYSDNPVDTAKMYINRHPIVKIVVGAAPGGGASLFISSLRQAFPGIPILVVTGDSRLIQISSEGITL